ncbi:MAG TPA: hypothetical protein VD927_09210 [Chryseosolibacter sp.]|nr:hypothetical protein [Chryseosolibacter sp.]
MKSFVTLISLSLLFVLANCKSADTSRNSGNIDSGNSTDLATALKIRLGPDPIAEENEAQTLILYKQQPGGHVKVTYKFVVVRKSDKVIIHEGQYQMGYVKWADNSTLELVSSGDGENPEKKFINLNINKY